MFTFYVLLDTWFCDTIQAKDAQLFPGSSYLIPSKVYQGDAIFQNGDGKQVLGNSHWLLERDDDIPLELYHSHAFSYIYCILSPFL